jgi:transcriptional regulator with XRE-family HTH domain
MYSPELHRPEARRALGDLLRRARYARGLTQARLEEWSGVDQTVISRLELGRPIGLRLGTLLQLLDALGVVGLEPRYKAWYPWSTDEPPAEPLVFRRGA